MISILLSKIYKTFDYIKTKISENRLFKLTIQSVPSAIHQLIHVFHIPII